MKLFMEKMSDKINQGSRFVLIVLFIGAFICIVYQVFSRFILQSSFINQALPMIDFSVFNLTWIEELIRYLFVWIVFLGIGIVYKNKGHAQVEILHHYISEKFKKKLLILIEMINSCVFIFLIFYGSSILQFTSQQISPSMKLNMTFIYATVLVCSIICLTHSVSQMCELMVKSSKDGKDDHQETHYENTNIG